VGRAAPAIGRAIELIVRALSRGGRLFFVGAGTSGRSA
jgi:N-acetylmuramic acid 6-phosphate etherase